MRAPVPTDDPLVWNYYPSDNPNVSVRVYELHFAEVPTFGSPPIVVEGVATFVPDTLRRPNGVRGYVRLTEAKLVK